MSPRGDISLTGYKSPVRSSGRSAPRSAPFEGVLMVYVEDIQQLKQIIDNNHFHNFTDLSEFILNELNNHNLYKFIMSPAVEEFVSAYIDRRNSLENKKLIRKYYNDLMDNLIM